MLWMLIQLLSYPIVWWCVFVAIAVVAARYGRLPGIFVGHVLVAGLVFMLDAHWVESAMASPGWDGTPDFDIVFGFGVTLRIVLINSVLLPVSACVLFRTRRRSNSHLTAAVAEQPADAKKQG